MSENKKKKKTKRSREKYPSLKRNLNSKVRQEMLDYDYVDQLSYEEKQYLEDFNSEYYNASVGKQADEGKDNRFIKGYDENGLSEVKKVQDANNARQRDLYGRVRNKVGATKLLNYEDSQAIVEDKLQGSLRNDNYEDALIDYLDYTHNLKDTTDDTGEDT